MYSVHMSLFTEYSDNSDSVLTRENHKLCCAYCSIQQLVRQIILLIILNMFFNKLKTQKVSNKYTYEKECF